MREKVKKFVSVNIPAYGNLRIALLENGIILNNDNVYFQHQGNDITIYEALCKIGFPVSIENIKLVQKALGETIYIVKFHKSSIYNDHKWTNASVFYLDAEYCVWHKELNFHHKIGSKVYFVHDNATTDNNLFNKNCKPEISKHTDPRIFNSKFLKVSDGITDNYWEEARVAQRIYDRENVDESLPDENIEIHIDRDHEDDGILCARISGNKGDIIIRKDFLGRNRLTFSATILDLNTHQETTVNPIDPIDYLNKIGIRNAKNVGTILKGLGVSAYHILQFPSCETRFAEDYEGILANEDCIKRNYSISIYDTTESRIRSNYGYDFSESVEAISPVRDYDHTLYFSILEPSNIHVFMPEDMYFPYRMAIEKFRKEDPEMAGGTVYLNASDPRAYAVFFDK